MGKILIVRKIRLVSRMTTEMRKSVIAKLKVFDKCIKNIRKISENYNLELKIGVFAIFSCSFHFPNFFLVNQIV